MCDTPMAVFKVVSSTDVCLSLSIPSLPHLNPHALLPLLHCLFPPHLGYLRSYLFPSSSFFLLLISCIPHIDISLFASGLHISYPLMSFLFSLYLFSFLVLLFLVGSLSPSSPSFLCTSVGPVCLSLSVFPHFLFRCLSPLTLTLSEIFFCLPFLISLSALILSYYLPSSFFLFSIFLHGLQCPI